jgi:hypothetical protein
MTEAERVALAQAIRTVVLREGGYGSVVRKTGVRQPLVSMALHQRLVVRTAMVERLFEFLNVKVPERGQGEELDQADLQGGKKEDVTGKLLGLLSGLSDGSRAADERLAALLAALKDFAAHEREGGQPTP